MFLKYGLDGILCIYHIQGLLHPPETTCFLAPVGRVGVVRAGGARGPRGGPTGPVKKVVGFEQDRNQSEPGGSESRVDPIASVIEYTRWVVRGAQKGEESESFLCLGSGLFIDNGAHVFSGTQELVRTRTRVQASSTSHLCPGAMGS